MSRADLVRAVFTDPIQRSYKDKGIEYAEASAETFAQDPVMPTQTELERIDMTRFEGGKVNAMLGSARAPNSPPKEWWK